MIGGYPISVVDQAFGFMIHEVLVIRFSRSRMGGDPHMALLTAVHFTELSTACPGTHRVGHRRQVQGTAPETVWVTAAEQGAEQEPRATHPLPRRARCLMPRRAAAVCKVGLPMRIDATCLNRNRGIATNLRRRKAGAILHQPDSSLHLVSSPIESGELVLPLADCAPALQWAP